VASDVRVVLDDDAIEALAKVPGMREDLLQAAEPAVRASYSGAPKLSGSGAASIRAEAVLDGPEWTARISWEQLFFYMYFHERGTKHLPARPFLVPGLDSI